MKRNTMKMKRGRSGCGPTLLRTAAAALLLGSAGIGAAQAAALAKCEAITSAKLATLPENLKIAWDAPVNTVLWKQSGIQISARCWQVLPMSGEMEAMFYRYRDDPKLIANGIAMYITYNGNRGHGDAAIPTGTMIPRTGDVKVTATVDVELVKIGATPSTPTDLPMRTVLAGMISAPNEQSDSARYMLYGFENVSFQKTTCGTTTPSLQVELGTHVLRKAGGIGSGIGSTSPSKDFAIGIQCDSGVAGDFVVNMMLEGNALDAANGVLALSPERSATGVGIQLLKGDGQPVHLGTPWKIADSPSSLGRSSNFSVPLSARYYQTDATAKPGTANGTATFTIIYK
ncbi:TPA: type 1 fimbrial protein [Burkholderia cenocepacia]|uniref:fimbrial protein n=1 Tax=unclassified Burkholderia TaxID=2613784 RepID=UPI00158B9D2F|nr:MULTISPECIES: fimbrial protein [unclassified Burkholderia]HEF5874732.1 type 1 fimbrial protein [Burkholderia cenocepacia]